MSEKIVTLSDATFDEHVKSSDVPVLVDFWAEWCGPCKMISPVLEEIAEEQAGKIQIGKLNIDDNLEVTRRFDVMSIPTLILFKDGQAGGPPDRGEAQGSAAPGDRGVPVGLPLSLGDEGAAVSDVQRRLTAILSSGAPIDADGVFGDGTRAAVEAFQHLRGLRVDGVCGPQTWNTLVEASFRIGDRFLYRRTPMLRGDDVADLQQRLSTLGFDTGRVDGIFGDRTSRASGRVPAQRRAARRRHRRGRHPPRAHPPGEPPPRTRVDLVGPGPGPVAPCSPDAHRPPRRHRRAGRPGQRDRRPAPTAGARRHPGDRSPPPRRLDAGPRRPTSSRSTCSSAFASTPPGPSATPPTGPGDPRRVTGRPPAGRADSADRCPACWGSTTAARTACRWPSCARPRMPSVLVELGPASLVVERAALLAAALSTALGQWADASWD